MKRACAFGLWGLLLLFFCIQGCGLLSAEERVNIDETRAIDEVAKLFTENIAAQDYASAWRSLAQDVQTDWPLADFAAKYQKLFAGTEITSLRYENGAALYEDKQGSWSCTVHYESTLMGAQDYTINMSLVQEGKNWRIQWSPALIFPGMAEDDMILVSNVTPTRGEIFDCKGRYLAQNGYNPSVMLDMAQYGRLTDQQRTTLMGELMTLLEMDQAKLEAIITPAEARSSSVALLKRYTQTGLSDELSAQLSALSCISIDTSTYTPTRLYPYHSILAHTLGYVGSIPEARVDEYVEKGYTKDATVGLAGLEKSYEDQLRGSSGLRVDIYASDYTRKKNLYLEPAVNGEDLYLTIDIDLQLQLEAQMAQSLSPDQSAVGLLMEVNTGYIRAMANAPTYDINSMVQGISQEEYQLLLSDTRKPLFNRCLQGLYPPGSIIKPFTAALGLSAGVITTDFVLDLPIEKRKWTPERDDWVYPPITRVSVPSNAVDLQRALAWSDNIYFAYTIMEVGMDASQPFFTSLGFTEAIPFDLSVATPQISNSVTNVFGNIKLLADSGYGQGELLMSPLQLACTFGALANRGQVLEPVLVERTMRSDTFSQTQLWAADTTVWRQTNVNSSLCDTLLPLLETVVTDSRGTARSIATEGLTIAAKTGTAEIGDDKSKEIGWLCGFTRNLDTNYLVAVMIEAKAEESGVPKVAISKMLFKYVAQHFIPDDPAPTDAPTPTDDPAGTDTPTPTAGVGE